MDTITECTVYAEVTDEMLDYLAEIFKEMLLGQEQCDSVNIPQKGN